jgi:hypothetical protein
MLTTFATEMNANCNKALDSVAIQIFPTNANAKQNKYIHQGMWKLKALTIWSCYWICKLHAQLVSYPNQASLLPEGQNVHCKYGAFLKKFGIPTSKYDHSQFCFLDKKQ